MRWEIKRKPSPYEWHDWFAWYPVTVRKTTRYWLEPVRRQYQVTYGGGRIAAVYDHMNSHAASGTADT